MPIKLIALDLDGTTLNSKSHLSERNRKTLELAIEQGVHVVIATGRTFSVLPEDIYKIKGIEYVLTSNGAELRNLSTQELLYSNYIDSHTVEELYLFLKEHPFMTEVFTGGRAYIDTYYYNTAKEVGLSYRHTEYVLNTRTPIDNVLNMMLTHRDTIENINLNFGNPADKTIMRELLLKFENITLTTSFDHNLEIGGASTSKGAGLKALCDILSLKPDEIMACGDSPNDGAMLQLSGVPVAVGNAKDVIKEMAVYVSGTNDEDGVAQAVEKFVLTK